MRARAAVLSIALIVIAAAPLSAAEKVWSGLVMAEFAEKPHPAPAQIAPFEKTLVELFGYNQFEVIGESSKTLKTGQEDWMATSKYFSLHVDARGESDSGYELGLKLYQEQQVLLETDTKLSRESPLVIKGPQVGGGQLILVLVANDEETSDPAKRKHRGHESSNAAVNAWRHLTRFVRNVLP
jgi:hypothetical protein